MKDVWFWSHALLTCGEIWYVGGNNINKGQYISTVDGPHQNSFFRLGMKKDLNSRGLQERIHDKLSNVHGNGSEKLGSDGIKIGERVIKPQEVIPFEDDDFKDF